MTASKQARDPRAPELLASTWEDGSGFFSWALRIGALVLVVIAISLASDWIHASVFGHSTNDWRFVAAQAVDAVFNGLAFALVATVLLRANFVRSRIPYFFALAWSGWAVFSFGIAAELPLPTAQAVAAKFALCVVCFAIYASVLKRFWRQFWITADREAESP